MNNRKEFLGWIQKQKGNKEAKTTMWEYDTLNRTYNIYEIDNITQFYIQGLGNKAPLYEEYLTSKMMGQKKSDKAENDGIALSFKPSYVLSGSGNNDDEQYEETVNAVSESDVIEEVSATGSFDMTSYKGEYNRLIAVPKRIAGTNEMSDFAPADSDDTPLIGEYGLRKEARQIIKQESLSLLGKAFFNSASIIDRNTKEADLVDYKSPKLIFDIVSARYSDIANGRFSIPMVSYVKYDAKANKMKRREDAFYYPDRVPEQYSAVSSFLQKNKANTYILDSLRDTIANENQRNPDTDKICLVPDYLGDFNDSIKAQIQGVGQKIIQIPRSIAAAYAYSKNNPIRNNPLQKDVTFVCYDYELNTLCRTEIVIHKNNIDDTIEYTRTVRKKYPGNKRLSSEKIYKKYLSLFCEKHHLVISEKTMETIVSTRDILKVIRDKKSVLFRNNGKMFSVDYDPLILNSILNDIENDLKADSKQNDSVYCVLTEVSFPNHLYYSFNDLSDGCIEIIKRIKKKEIIWKEYLPELSLEVIKNGHFSNLQLVKKGDYQNISIDSMDADIEIKLEDGAFSLPLGKKTVYIPLTREEFGYYQRDKMAMFQSDELEQGSGSKQVELKLTYHYGDPDSYRLIATDNSDNVFTSEWCEQKDMQMEVVYPEYKKEEQVEVKPEDVDYMENFIEGLKIRVSMILNGSYKPKVKEKDDFQESNILDFVSTSDGKGPYFCRRNIFKNVTSIENVQNNPRCKAILIDIINSNIYTTFLEFLVDEDNSKLAAVIGNDKKLRLAVSISVNSFMSMLGAYYLLNKEQIEIHKAKLLSHFCVKGMEEYLVNASRCMTDDSYDVFSIIGRNIEDNCVVKDIRNISSACWLNPDWIFNLYEASPEAINAIIDTIYSYLTEKAKNEVVIKTLKVRDVLEVLLSVCRLRKIDPTILDPNDKRTRDMLVAIKELDQELRDKRASLKKPFVSRVRYNRDDKFSDGLGAVNDSCYLLITQLSGSRHLNLIGFVDE